jgi:hypothetical protein
MQPTGKIARSSRAKEWQALLHSNQSAGTQRQEISGCSARANQWVRNAEAAGEVTLKKGGTCRKFRLRPISGEEKPPILKAYLDTFRREVQRYFPIPAGSPQESFAAIAQSYPAFELLSD